MTNLDARRHVVFSQYRELPVPASLANSFLCFWKQEIIGSGGYVHRVLPDACVDMVFMHDALPVVVGSWTDPFVVRLSAGTTIVGARLHAGRAPGILLIAAAELLNRSVTLCDCRAARGSNLPSMSQRLFRSLTPWRVLRCVYA